MKKKVIIVSLILLVTILLLVIIVKIITGCNAVKYNNTTKISDSITQTYPKSTIDKLQNDIKSKSINYSIFKSSYNVQCLRKTYQGYYAVLLQEGGGRVFVFMDEKFNLNEALVIDSFKIKEDFGFLTPNITSKSKVLAFDQNTILLPISSMDVTVHIVKEGIIVIKYNRMNEGLLLDDPIVDSIEFIDNKVLPAKEDEFINLNVPYILDLDKTSN